jgi:uncharacterized lipoprotein YmbA
MAQATGGEAIRTGTARLLGRCCATVSAAGAVVHRASPRLTAGAATLALALALALALVAACASSPPTRFYTLSDTAPEAAAPRGVGLITISGVTIPGEIDRPEIVRRVSPNQLSISELDRWAAPLDETIRRVLSDDIARRVPNPAPGKQYAVAVDIHEFYGDAGCNVTLRAVWSSKQVAEAGARGAQPPSGSEATGGTQPASGSGATGGSQPPSTSQPAGDALARSEELRVPSRGACPATLPETMSIALGQLSDRIVAGVGR